MYKGTPLALARTGIAVPVSAVERMARASDMVRMVAEALADLAREEAMQACEETRLYLRARTLRASSAGVARAGLDTLARLAAKHAEAHEDLALTLDVNAKEGRIPGSDSLV